MALATTQPPPRQELDIAQALELHRQGRLDEAEQIYSAILTATPEQRDALHLLGVVRHQQGRNVEALQLVGAALKAAPNSADILNNHGRVLGALGRHEEALARFEEVLAIHGDHVHALSNRADTLAQLGRYQEALAVCERVLALKPDHLVTLNKSGGLHMRLGRVDAAIACYDRALAIEPTRAELHINKGKALRAVNRFEDALASFEAAAETEPGRVEAHWNAGLVRLRLGDFKAGWKDYEWRWRKADWAGLRRDFAAPLWLGEQPVEGKTILLHAEQGLGDTIQFVRYVPLIARRGATVILECQAGLVELLRNIEGLARIVARGDLLPAFDLHCPLLSLPLAFETELATIPANSPLHSAARPKRIARWRRRLPHNGRLRVGICWAGNPDHLNDRNRSIPLERFATLLAAPGVDFVSLQRDVTRSRMRRSCVTVAWLSSARSFRILPTPPPSSRCSIWSSPSIPSVAHLAGAMGKADGVLVPFSPDWRWLLDRTDSPWYPTMRLFRQTAIGDWDGPLGAPAPRACRCVVSAAHAVASATA